MDFEPQAARLVRHDGNYSIAAYATQVRCTANTPISTAVSCTARGWNPKPARRPTWSGSATRCSTSASTSGSSKGRIHGTIDYYDSKSYDLLYLKVLPYTSGFNRAWTNIGDTRNRGWEVSLSTVPVEIEGLPSGGDLSYYRNNEELVRCRIPDEGRHQQRPVRRLSGQRRTL